MRYSGIGRAVALAAAVAVCCGAAMGQAVTQTSGPDIIVCGFPDVSNSTTAVVNGITYDQFAVGTTSANRGDTPINWFYGTGENRHPAISEGIYRYEPSEGRFEQLAVGSVKHGFAALQDNDCAFPNYFSFGCSPHGDETQLGVGCADPYCCNLNFAPAGMAPRYEINASTGLFPYPNSSTYLATSGPSRVRLTELQGAPTGTRYFEEAQYIVGDDAGVHNNNNNASWQEVVMSPAAPAPSATDFTTSLTGSIHREQPAIYAWQTIDSQVQVTTFDVPNDGRFILACRVTGPTAGLYTYEYALHNLNSHRCAGSFIVPLPGTQNALTSIGFHDSEVVGEPNQTPANAAANDWTVSGGGAAATSVSWAGPSYSGTPPVYTMTTTPYQVATFTQGTGNDQTANVLRWGMMFNYRFTSEVAPASTGSIAIGLFRPGSGTAFTFANVPTPAGATVGNLTGTCCNGIACTVTTASACTGTAGLAGTTCSPNPCTNGACCLPGLTCSQLNSIDCTAGGGTYQGDGTSCGSGVCPTPGACCLPTGSCVQTTSSACTAAAGTYHGDSTACGSTNCPVGACCSSTGTCSLTAATGCTGAGSTYHGDGTTCSTMCPVGACCVGSTQTCTNISSAGCAAQTGSYQGDNTTCATSPCPFGACCMGCSGCVVTTANGCTGSGNTYHGNGSACDSTAGCTILNGGFETGAFAPAWTQFADMGYTYVINGAFGALSPHGGGFHAVFGPVSTAGGGIQQTIPAHVGDQVTIGFWYAQAGGQNFFNCTFDGHSLVSFTNDTGHTTYTQFSFPVTVGANNPMLAFTFSNPPSYSYLDDVTVCIQSAMTGVCCRGATCSTAVASAAACTSSLVGGQTAGAVFAPAGSCNAAGNGASPCCYANYNKVNGVNVQDIFDFLNDWFAGSPFANTGGTGTPAALAVQNIFDFLNDWFGGGC